MSLTCIWPFESPPLTPLVVFGCDEDEAAVPLEDDEVDEPDADFERPDGW